MIKRIVFLVIALIPAFLSAQTVSILEARSKPLGTTVTVRGIVTNGNELGKIRYFQDESAGIAAYPGAGSVSGFDADVAAGDSILLTGTLVDYHGLLEITPITAYSIIASGRPMPAAKVLSLSALSDVYESRLVAFECVVFAEGGATFSSGAHDVADGDGHTGKLYLNSDHPLIGESIPGAPVYLQAILSEYNDFQLLARSESDFSIAQCFYFTDPPEQGSITTTGFKVNWATNLGANTKLHYGNTPALGSTIDLTATSAGQSYDLTGLLPGTVYWVQVEAEHNGTTIFSKSTPFATQSLSSGEIKVFFNHSIDASFSNGFVPDGQSIPEVLAETIARIDAAQQTLDVAMYNNNRSDLTNAVKAAYARGVRVRYVASLDASNTALNTPPAFPVLYGNTEAIMHDKFLVIDANLPDKAWVMSGSLNWTNQNINNDFNNTLFIQDQSLARTYELEFEEMWGGKGDEPDLAQSRFASNKSDNTPHRFIIGGKQVESWFSPSDLTTNQIVRTVYTAESEALFATFSFTKNEVGDALVDVFNNNTQVRGMIENISDPGAEIDYLQSVGIDCRPHSISGDLHHKYGVFDANGSDPTVLTGSHNWTFAAETVNDENTLILHDYRLASLYKAEFEQRWQEIATPTNMPVREAVRLFPNPVTDHLSVLLNKPFTGEVLIRDITGRCVFTRNTQAEEFLDTFDLHNLPSGGYYFEIRSQHELFCLPFQKI